VTTPEAPVGRLLIDTLTRQQYRRSGYGVVPNGLAEPSLGCLRLACEACMAEETFESAGRSRLHGDGTPRAFFGVHEVQPGARDIAVDELSPLASEVLEVPPSQLYLFQTKLTLSSTSSGSGFDWHQDFGKWHKRDGVRDPSAMTTVVVFLDDVGPGSGPLTVLPATHCRGLVDPDRHWFDQPQDAGGDPVAAVILVGPPGTVTMLHPLLLHGSPPRRHRQRRLLFFATFNRRDNSPVRRRSPTYFSASPD